MAKHACAGKQPVTHNWKETACTSLSFTFFTSKNALPKKNKTHHSLNFLKTQNSLNICYTEICSSIIEHILPRVFGNLYFCLYLLQFHS